VAVEVDRIHMPDNINPAEIVNGFRVNALNSTTEYRSSSGKANSHRIANISVKGLKNPAVPIMRRNGVDHCRCYAGRERNG
jgi:hypothetical protein